MTGSDRPWLAAHEGYYGRPLDPQARIDLVRWLPTVGYDAYIHSPKDDPFQRARWREPYPEDAFDSLRAVADACADAGIGFGLTISPGLDWQTGDANEVDALARKIESLVPLGLATVGITWDDTPGDGEELGADHAGAVATVADRIGREDVRWFTCPVDYAVSEPTPYLRGFADALGPDIDIMWTGPSVVTDDLAAEPARSLVAALGRPVVFAENFPVNDVGMSPALHLGPYPHRAPAAMAAMSGALVNFMSRPLASRIGLALAASAWREPSSDRIASWRDAVSSVPGLEPLARACRAWLDDPGPDPELLEWAMAASPDDHRLHDFLDAGCRADLDPELEAEVEPWLDAWEREATVMASALSLLQSEDPSSFQEVAMVALAWRAAQAERKQAFGTRFAIYPSTRHGGGGWVARPNAIVRAENLTDVVMERLLSHD